MAQNYYEILGIKRTATKKEIKEASRKAQIKWHPDKYQGKENSEYVNAKFSEVREAAEILTDKDAKTHYDAFLESFSGRMGYTYIKPTKASSNDSFEEYTEDHAEREKLYDEYLNAQLSKKNPFKGSFEDYVKFVNKPSESSNTESKSSKLDDFFKNSGFSNKNSKTNDQKKKNNDYYKSSYSNSNEDSDSVNYQNAFKFAAQGNLWELEKLLNKNSKYANAENSSKESPLSTVFHNKFSNMHDIIKLLLKHGAKFSPHDFTRKDGNFAKNLVDMLETKIASNPELKYSISAALKDVAHMWLTQEKLFQLAWDNKINFVSVILETKKVDIKMDQTKESPLSTAFLSNKHDMAKALLKGGIKFSEFDFKRTDGNFAKGLFKRPLHEVQIFSPIAKSIF